MGISKDYKGSKQELRNCLRRHICEITHKVTTQIEKDIIINIIKVKRINQAVVNVNFPVSTISS